MMDVFYTQKFLREYKKLDKTIKAKAEKQERLFRDDPHSSILKTHKLKGELVDFWSFSVNFSYRIIFEFQDEGTAIFHSIGNHKIYK
jgi:addiction module RelE/StbE family toxin